MAHTILQRIGGLLTGLSDEKGWIYYTVFSTCERTEGERWILLTDIGMSHNAYIKQKKKIIIPSTF